MCNKVWNKCCSSKLSTTTYFAFMNRLTAKDRLQQWTNIENTRCSLCNITEESSKHLFFNCTYSNYIWEKLNAILGQQFINSNNQDLQTMLEEYANTNRDRSIQNDIKDVKLTTTVWHIWQERNQRVF